MKKWVSMLVAMLIGVACAAHSQTGNVRIVIAFPPGGPVDFVARVLAEGLAKELNATIIVENRPGANGGIAAQFVAKSVPDGSTLWLPAPAPR